MVFVWPPPNTSSFSRSASSTARKKQLDQQNKVWEEQMERVDALEAKLR